MSEVEIRTLKAEARSLRRELDEWLKNAKNEGKPICISCASMDAAKGRMKDYADYQKGIKEKAKHYSKIKPNGSKHETPVPYVLIDYECPNGHGISMHYTEDEFTAANSKKVKV